MHGFRLKEKREIAELMAVASLYVHERTGAEVLSVEANDENKVFGVTFRTPPSDSTGVAHILEHSVLCGSKRYPTREPFVELLKGSLQTFLNAFTFPDKTCYPVASQNLQDFHNLVNVYLDAAFHPLLSRQTYEQEAWHYEIAPDGQSLIYKGVVFNEMKGVYSSPDSVIGQFAQESLFPDVTYGLDYGGHPAHIPNLTYEQLTGFHRRFYHPSNSRAFFYGDDPPADRLKLLAAYFDQYEAAPTDSAIPLQPAFAAPRRVTRTFQAGGDGLAKAMITANWVLGDATDFELQLALEMLTHVLIGTPASPLRKALVESGLGEDIAGGGFEPQCRQMFFSTGLKGVELPNVGKVETLIFQTLENLAANGIDRRTINATLNTIEFRLRENNTGPYPRGLALMLRALTTWLYDGDPFSPLAFEGPLKSLQGKIATNPRFFEDLIRTYFLENQHRSILVMEPHDDVATEADRVEQERLHAVRKKLSPSETAALTAANESLRAAQSAPESAASLALIPQLTLGDLDKQIKTIPLTEVSRGNPQVVTHDIFTSGITYFDVGFDLHQLPAAQLGYAMLIGRALIDMGTRDEDYVSLLQRIGQETGGIMAQVVTSACRGSARGCTWLFLRGKTLDARVDRMLGIYHDVLSKPKFDQRDRFRQIVLEEKAGVEARLLPTGHGMVNTRLRSRFGEADAAADRTRGIGYLLFLRELVTRMDADWSAVRTELTEVFERLVNRQHTVFNVTAEAKTLAAIQPALDCLVAAIPSFYRHEAMWDAEPGLAQEGLTLPSQVNYVGLGGSLYDAGMKLHGSSLVVARHVRSSWLWERVRVMGGAYGGFCYWDPRSGVVTFASYRDPNLEKTLVIYRETATYLQDLKLDDRELTKSIVGAIGDLDQYMLPDMRGFTSLTRHLTGDDDAYRQRIRDEVLGTQLEDFHRFGQWLEKMLPSARTVVLGSADAITRAGISPVIQLL